MFPLKGLFSKVCFPRLTLKGLLSKVNSFKSRKTLSESEVTFDLSSHAGAISLHTMPENYYFKKYFRKYMYMIARLQIEHWDQNSNVEVR